jgi:hypothetical protein
LITCQLVVLQLCDTPWNNFIWVGGSALFEKRNAEVDYPASSRDSAAALKRECDSFVSAAEDAAPKAIATLKLDVNASTLFLCEGHLRLCKKGGVSHEQARAVDLASTRAKAAAEKAAKEAAAREAARQQELEAASAAVAAKSLTPYSNKYSVHSGLGSAHFSALGMSESDAQQLASMVAAELQAQADAKAAAEAAAAEATVPSGTGAGLSAASDQSQSSSSFESDTSAEKPGVVGGILNTISSFFSESSSSSSTHEM